MAECPPNINTLNQQSFREDPNEEECYSRQVTRRNTCVLDKFDALSAAYPDAITEVYTYYNGGLTGAVVATVTVIYTDASKNNVQSVVRS